MIESRSVFALGWGGKWGVTTEKHRGKFGGSEDILHLDWSGGYMNACTHQNSTLTIGAFIVCKLHFKKVDLKK